MPKHRSQHQRETRLERQHRRETRVEPQIDEQKKKDFRSLFRFSPGLIFFLLVIAFLSAFTGAGHPGGHSMLVGALLGLLIGVGGSLVLVLLIRLLNLSGVNWEKVGTVFLDIGQGLLEGFLGAFIESGCCLGAVLFFITIIGTVSGLLIGHTLLLGALTGGGAALLALTAFVSLACFKRKDMAGISRCQHAA